MFNLATQTIKPLMRRLPMFKPNQDLRWSKSQFSRRKRISSKKMNLIKGKGIDPGEAYGNATEIK